MRLEIDMPKHQYNNIMEIDSINLGRVPYKGIIMYAINAIKRGKALEQEPTTKNDLGVDCIDRAQAQTEIEMNASRYTIAKERGGMGQVEWSDQLIKVSDAVDIIRNLPSVTPQFSSELEKNSKKLEKDFGESDCISRADALDCVNWGYNFSDIYKKINELSSVTPQEPQTFRWCTGCKEYDQEKHCCHRWSNVIRNTVEEMKQEYIEREVLDKIRAEIEQLPTNTRINWDGCLPDIDYPEIEYVDVSKAGLLEIINKYKAESEE